MTYAIEHRTLSPPPPLMVKMTYSPDFWCPWEMSRFCQHARKCICTVIRKYVTGGHNLWFYGANFSLVKRIIAE